VTYNDSGRLCAIDVGHACRAAACGTTVYNIKNRHVTNVTYNDSGSVQFIENLEV